MRYHNITKDDMLNGDGLRVVLWVSGCDHCCESCHNPITWDPNGGLLFEEEAKKELFEELERDYISGLTLSGGDPLYAGNRKDVLKLVGEVREKFPDKTIWMYTGFTWESICDLEIIDFIDILVDGEFVLEQADPKLYWRGSANQRVIDVRRSKETGEVVLHCE
ncbi:MAG: anaerobic ribonucleoside-triphosphate reductase activating protein [Lachnospiraceae bacterium]|nr:anaerobic ribonucleoside-triphosphate reductase activating protein [Lachnospiraceae bacterium]